MEQTPLVSVIVAIYNIEPYIKRCVDSILAQEYTNLEIILVDDGSTDACPEICDAYANLDSRIKVVHKKNGGLSDARNAGIAVANGDYIGYVDGDDWIAPGMYGTMVQCCEDYGAQIAVCRYSQYMEILLENEEQNLQECSLNENVIENFAQYKKMDWDEGTPTQNITCLSKREAFENFISAYGKYQIHNSVWSKLYSKEVCKDLWFPVGKNSEDIMYTTKTFSKAEKVVFVDQDFYHYVCGRAGSIMNVGRFERRLRDELPFWKEQEQLLRDSGEDALAEQSLFYACRRIMSYYLDAYDYERKEKNQKESYAKQFASVILKDKKKLRAIAKDNWVRRGDKVRLQLFLVWPRFYAWVCHVYENMIVPIKSKL